MSIVAVLEAVQADADLAAAWPALSHRIGSEYLANLEDKLPRAVWVPARPGQERFGPPTNIGQTPQAFLDRLTTVEIHLAAESFDDAEALGHDVASTLCRLLLTVVEIVAGGFLSENEGGWSQGEHVYVLTVAIRLPIVDQLRGQTPTTATVDSAKLSSAFKRLDGSEQNDVPTS